MKNNEINLSGKIAIVTGASRGIGESIACDLAAAGAEIILTGRKIEGLNIVVEKIQKSGGKAEAVICHNGNMDHIKDLFKHVADKYGKLDILVNNAATNPYFGGVLNADEKAWDKINEVNLKGVFFMCQSASNMMMKDGGSIINIASINGVRPALMQGIYSITKAGVISLTKVFAKELAAYKIRVNAVLPGLTDTKFSAAIIGNDSIMKAVLPTIPMGRVAQPDEISGAILYLASDMSTYTTGASIEVDGGSLI
jgi:NAD(P)-dependent dehydrogenase (short-subunit alcohol dehydrogenase family)